MVSGTQWPGGDPFLQRQNEPSMAVSSRNRQHLLAGANDYRTVDLSLLTNDETGDAWLGVFKSLDGGLTWRSTLLPGCPYNVPECNGSPLQGTALTAGSDPVVRAGSNGMFYYAFLAFRRGEKGRGTIALARFIDDNNKEKVTDDPIRYLSTSIADSGNPGQVFHDKPWLAVGLPQAGGPQCRIPASGSTPEQTFPAGPVYVAYTTFLGGETVAKLNVTTSNDCGATWNNPVYVSPGSKLVQGAALAVDPVSGAVYVAWRQFAGNGDPNAIKIAKSTDGGKKFSAPLQIATIDPFEQGSSIAGFRTQDFPSIAVDASGRVYATWSDRVGPVGLNGVRDARVVISTSLDGSAWTSPVPVENTPATGYNPGRGHQIMPSISIVAGKVMVMYYDLREDATAGELQCLSPACLASRNANLFDEVRLAVGDLYPSPPNSNQLSKVFGAGIQDAAPPGLLPLQRRHTIDVRVAQAEQPGSIMLPLGAFQATRVSQYPYGVPERLGPSTIKQLRFNVPNLPMFGQGTKAFMGDYIDIAADSIVPATAGQAAASPRSGANPDWKFNTSPSNSTVFHGVWTDNRDVRPPVNGDWTNYTPLITPTQGPPGQACVVGQAGMRNQNIYTSRISQGLIVSSPQNFKQLGSNPLNPAQLLQRGFVVTVQNATGAIRTYRLTIVNQPVGGKASFLQTPVPGKPDPLVTLDASIGPRSSISRTVFATSTDPHASVTVNVMEINSPGGPPKNGGLQDSITLNADLTNPNLSADLTNTDITSKEVYSADLTNADLTNSTPVNADLTNADLTNADLTNADLTNADLTNTGPPNADLTNADLTNADLTNADLTNADLTNGTIGDTTFKIKNTGNTAAVYKINTLVRALPAGFKSQLIVYRVYKTPQLLRACTVQEVGQVEVIANIPNPTVNPPDPGSADLTNADLTNTTLSLAPGETGYITYRVIDPDKTSGPNICGGPNFPPCQANDFNPTTSVKAVPVPQAISTGATAPAIPLLITSLSLADGVRTVFYSQPVQFLGGTAPLTWTISSGALPPGLNISPLTGAISGTPTATGAFTFTVTVIDSATTPQQTDSQTLTIRIFDPLVVAPAALNDGVTGSPYSQAISTTGGFGSVTLQLLGVLPPGLGFNPVNGLISGTPTTAGTYPFTITATDSATPPQVVPKNYSIRIAAPLAVTTPSLPPAAFSIGYNFALSANGGLGNKTWAITAGALPTGMNLSTGGVLGGAPTALGGFAFTVHVVDSSSPAPLAANKDFSLIVTLPPGATLSFQTQPSNTTAGLPITPDIKVKAQTAAAVPIPGVAITMAVNSNPFAGALIGTTTVLTDAAGIATFSNLILDKSGSNYSLVASALTFSPSGDVQYVLPPPSVELNTLESDTKIRVFQEKSGFTLPSAIGVDIAAPGTYNSLASLTPGNVSAGALVDCYYLHADPVGAFPNTSQFQTGSITFSSDILGVIVLDPTFNLSDSVLALPGTTYGVNARQLEMGNPFDSVIELADRRTLNISLANNTAVDDIRVITAAAGTIATTAVSNPFNSAAVSGFITTVAGSAWTFTNPSGLATTAPLGLGFTAGVAADAAGNFYIADPPNHRVFKVTTGGVLSVVAGTGLAGFTGDGPATGNRLNFPSGVAVDSVGNVYISDTGNQRIRRVSGGIMTTIAGNGNFGFGADNVPATTTSLANPNGLAVDNAGNVYFADTNNNRIRKISGGVIATVAGNGAFGFTGDNVAATTTALANPFGVFVDGSLNIYIADTQNHRIRKVDAATNQIATIAGTGVQASSPDGPALSTSIDRPRSVLLDLSGNVVFTDHGGNKIRKIVAGSVSTIAGDGSFAFAGDGSAATAASLANPSGMSIDGSGNLYIADGPNERIRKIAGANISTVAGNGLFKYAGDGFPATSASLDGPNSAAVDGSGNLYIADVGNQVIRRVTPAGAIGTFAGTGSLGTTLGDGGAATAAPLSYPFGVAAGTGGVYITDTFYRGRIRQVNGGIISTPGTGFNNEMGVAADGAGNIYIADSAANRIRKISVPSMTLTTIAGTGAAGGTGDGGPATSATLNFPTAVAIDPSGNVYVADRNNHRIRRIDAITGIITTVAGAGTAGFSGDNAAATAAQLSSPNGVAVTVTAGGTVLYIADTNNQRIRKMTVGGVITTFAGTGIFGFTGDNGPATNASLASPHGVALDAAGNVYITDTSNDRVRRVIP